MLRPSAPQASVPAWLPVAVLEHLHAFPDQRVGEASPVLPSALENKSQRPGANAGASAAKASPQAVSADARPAVAWRGVLAALQPMFSVPTPAAWATQPVEVAPQKAAPGGSKSAGSASASADGGASRAQPKTIFSFLPALPPLFAEWADWEAVAPAASMPGPAGLLSLQPDDHGEAVASSVPGTTRQPGKGGAAKPTAAAPAASNSAATVSSTSKHSRSDAEAASQRKPRWAALLHALSTERKPHAPVSYSGAPAAVACRVASFVAWSALVQLQDPVPESNSGAPSPPTSSTPASCSEVANILLDSLWLARLCRAGLDAASLSSDLGLLSPSLPHGADGAAVAKATPRATPRADGHDTSGSGAACESCEILAHVSIVICASVSRSGRAADHIGSFGPAFVDSLLAAVVPTPPLLAANPALAAYVLHPARPLAGASPACFPALPVWWDVQVARPSLSVRLWCAEALRCLALCDRIHRVVDVMPPSALPSLSDAAPSTMDKGAKAPKTAAAASAPSKDIGGAKKSAKQHKAEAAFDAASTLAAVNAALKPIAPALSALLPGLDSDVKVRRHPPQSPR